MDETKGETKKPEIKKDQPLIDTETKIKSDSPKDAPETVPAVATPPPQFFDDFSTAKKRKKFRLAIFLIFAVLLSALLFLLKPRIESYINPKPSLEEYMPVSVEPTSMHLEINNPDDELLTFDKTINISGKTNPKSSIIISNGDLNWGLDADTKGEFSRVIDLKPGINELIIYAFDPQGNNKIDTRLVYLSEEKI